MTILGIESSSQAASIALLTEGLTRAEYTINYKLTHSETLLPMLDEIVSRLDFELSDLDAIAVSAGPGSFTGLRIGAATAKGLGLALEIPLISVPTLDAMAYGLYRADVLICPMLDARRSQVYTGVYVFDDGEMRTVYSTRCVVIDELINWLNERGEEVIFLGDGANVDEDALTEGLTTVYSFAPAHMNRPRAAAVAALGMEYYKKGLTVTAAAFAPQYLRKVEAEQAFEEAVIEGRADELKAGHILKEESK